MNLNYLRVSISSDRNLVNEFRTKANYATRKAGYLLDKKIMLNPNK